MVSRRIHRVGDSTRKGFWRGGLVVRRKRVTTDDAVRVGKDDMHEVICCLTCRRRFRRASLLIDETVGPRAAC